MIYFGTKDRMIWAKPPAVNTPLSKTGTSNTGVDLNGGGYAKLSPAASRDYTFTWGASPAKDIYDILDYRTGAYGNGLLYYLDPFAMKCNVLSESFSFPRMLCDIYKMGGTNSQPTGSRAIRENLAPNPSFERMAASGVAVTRTNIIHNPAPVGSSNWTAQGALSPTMSSHTSGGPINDGPFRRMTFTQSQSSWRRHAIVNSAQTVTVGRTYTLSAYIRSSVDTPGGWMGIQWLSSTGAILSESNTSATPLSAGEWTRLQRTAVAPEGAVRVTVFIGLTTNTSSAPGEYLDAAAVLFEESNQAHPYFDGSTPPMVGATPSWAGAANASMSSVTLYGETVLENLATNPSFEVGTNLEIRRNLVTVPLISLSMTGWTARAPEVTVGSVENGIGRVFNIVGSVGVGSYLLTAPAPGAPVIGSAYSGAFSVYNRGSVAITLRAAIYWPGPNTYDYGPDILVPAGGWAELPIEGAIAPAGATAIAFRVTAGTPGVSAGQQFTMANFTTLDNYPVNRNRFNGETMAQPDPDMVPSWVGAVNSSQSILTVTLPTNVSGNNPERATRLRSSKWSKFGGYSLRVIPGNGASYGEVTISGLTAGRTYTVAVYRKLDAPIPPPHDAQLFNSVFFIGGSPQPTPTYLDRATNVAGESIVRFTFTATTTTHGICLGHGGAYGTPDMYWDGFTIADGTHPGLMPFDGSNSYDEDLYPVWSGAVNGSTSSMVSVLPTRVLGGGGRFNMMSSRYAQTGKFTTRVLRTGTGPTASNGAVAYTFSSDQLNRPYRVSATITIPPGYDSSEDVKGSGGWSRGLFLLSNMNGGVQAPDQPGTYRLSTVLTPTGVNQTLRLGGGGLWGQSVYWDDLIVSSDYDDGPYFDGSFPDSDGLDYSWTGTEHDSASTISVPISNPKYTTLNQPIAVAVSGASSAKHYIPVPSGYSLWVSYVATANILQANGTAMTATYPTDTVYQWTKFTTSQELQWVGSGTVWGAQAVILRNGETPDPNHQWTPGKGNSGLRFSGEPQVNGLSAVIGGHAGMVNATATFKETGLWE